MDVGTLTDRLAAGLSLYIENYFIAKDSGLLGLKPTYAVDYEIANISELSQYMDIDNYWVYIITGSGHISDLPEYLQGLVKQYAPRFFEDYPQYKSNPYFIE